MRVLFDTNVMLDVLLVREPHVRDAAQLWKQVEQGHLVGLVAATSATTVAYFVEKAYDAAQVTADLRHLLQLFEVAPVTRAELERALDAGFGDYEDAVLHETARAAGADAIVTRNEDDFGAATLPVYTPSDLLARLRTGAP